MTRIMAASQFLFAALSVGLSAWVRHRLSDRIRVPLSRYAILLILGVVSSFLLGAFETRALRFLELDPADRQTHTALLAFALLVQAPVLEGTKVLLIWPLYRSGLVTSGLFGSFHGALVGMAFFAGECLRFALLSETGPAPFELRVLLSFPFQVVAPAAYCHLLGVRGRDRYFGLAWVLCTGIHALARHILFVKGGASWAIALPLALLASWLGFWLLFRQAGPSRRSSAFFELEGLSLREVFRPAHRPLKLVWIAFGAFVTLGVVLALLGAAVYAGHRFGIDFALAEEGSGYSGLVPVLLLGSAMLGAFPLSAYLVARASGADSVVEPAWSTAMAIVLVLALFSVTEPTAVIVALGIAPVGFALACLGAWFGLERA